MSNAPSGWESGFFRVDIGAPPGQQGPVRHLHRNRKTGEVAPQPYDLTETDPFTDWEPLFVWRGKSC